ncbi:MAG: enoyl-CoA hydratase/isomerase family protein [Candidatus Bathyarchaeia archaeon]
MSYETLICEKRDGIAKITLNRPRVLNAINAQLAADLNAAMKDAEDDPDIRVVILAGAGRAFCAGADIRGFARRPEEGAPPPPPIMVSRHERIMRRGREYHFDETYTKPIIAMVHGYCLGAGFEMAMRCDMIVASEDAQFGQPEINVVGVPGGGGTQRLPRLIGTKKALEIIMTGDRISAAEAERLGIVNEAVPREKLEEATYELANKLLSKSPVFLRLAKSAVYRGLNMPLNEGLAWESILFALCFTTEDQKEASRAFIEKRTPVFKGR